MEKIETKEAAVLIRDMHTLRTDIRACITKHGIRHHPQFGSVFAYGVDDYGGEWSDRLETMLCLAVSKKVKAVSPANTTADLFVKMLLEEMGKSGNTDNRFLWTTFNPVGPSNENASPAQVQSTEEHPDSPPQSQLTQGAAANPVDASNENASPVQVQSTQEHPDSPPQNQSSQGGVEDYDTRGNDDEEELREDDGTVDSDGARRNPLPASPAMESEQERLRRETRELMERTESERGI
ncbi:MAG: hypothetical protein LQ338_004859 [Usnochroma carphineum]|nr:MAG: hypothetical protein LQ338_004859 [Usnochroma carphineum]